MTDTQDLLTSLEAEFESEMLRIFAKKKIVNPDERVSVALILSRALADYMALSWGGQQIYIPIDNRRRSRMIYDEFTGNNHAELARKYGVSIHTVYRNVKREQNRSEKKSTSKLKPSIKQQCSLFDD